MYQKTVQKFDIAKYGNAPEEVVSDVFEARHIRTSVNNEVWICVTCHNTLIRGRMPAQAKANRLGLVDIPPELLDLNQLETRLISLRIPFMKIVSLASGKQQKICGPAINVPTDLQPVCSLLPRLPSQTQNLMVPMKLKCKLSYKGHHYDQFVCQSKVMAALRTMAEEEQQSLQRRHQ